MQHTAYLSLGSNLGNKTSLLRAAEVLLAQRVGTLLARSNDMESEPVGFVSEHTFVNNCIAIATSLTPMQLLEATQAIERELGRTHKTVNGIHTDRLIDIDIILYEDKKLYHPLLTLPHPRMYERAFVMKPLKEIITESDGKLLQP